MRNWIAGAMTVLGTLLVLGGAVTIILRAWWKPAADAAAPASAPSGADLFSTAPVVPAPDTRPARLFGRLDAPERLIAWGIVLLVLAAVAAGAIGFNLGASAPVK